MQTEFPKRKIVALLWRGNIKILAFGGCLFKETWPTAVPWRVVGTVIGPAGKFMLSLGMTDMEGSLGGDLGAAFTCVEKDHRKGLPFLGTELWLVGGNQRTLFSA